MARRILNFLKRNMVSAAVRISIQTVHRAVLGLATLARDLKRLTELGYRAEKAVAVDMFPRTSHVETVALLIKELE